MQHLLITDTVSESKGIKADFDLNLFLMRGIGYNTIHSSTETYVFSKLGQILIVGVILNNVPLPEGGWTGTEIKTTGGTYQPSDFAVSPCVFTFFQTCIDDMRGARELISPKQIQVIDDSFFKKFGIRSPV